MFLITAICLLILSLSGRFYNCGSATLRFVLRELAISLLFFCILLLLVFIN